MFVKCLYTFCGIDIGISIINRLASKLTNVDRYSRIPSCGSAAAVAAFINENQVSANFEVLGKRETKFGSSPVNIFVSRRTIQLKLCILNKCVTSNISVISF